MTGLGRVRWQTAPDKPHTTIGTAAVLSTSAPPVVHEGTLLALTGGPQGYLNERDGVFIEFSALVRTDQGRLLQLDATHLWMQVPQGLPGEQLPAVWPEGVPPVGTRTAEQVPTPIERRLRELVLAYFAHHNPEPADAYDLLCKLDNVLAGRSENDL